MGICVLFNGQTQYDVLNIFNSYMANAFEKVRSNTKSIIIDFRKQADTERFLTLVEHHKIDFIFDINGRGITLKMNDGRYLYNAIGIKFFSYFVDAPFYHITRLSCDLSNGAFSFCDKQQLKYLPGINASTPSYFIPIGGCKFGDISEPTFDFKSREIDVLFCGSYTSYKETFSALLNLDDEIAKTALMGMAELMLGMRYSDYYTTFKNMYNLDDEEAGHLIQALRPTLRYLDDYLRTYTRHTMIESLLNSGIKLHVYGNGWENSGFTRFSNFIYQKAIDYTETLRLMTKAKMVLTPNCFLEYGAHDRTFSTMLNGAVCVAEANSYLRDNFVDMHDIAMFDRLHLNDLSDKIKELTQNEELYRKIAVNGYEKASREHTWENRATEVIKILNV